MLPFCTLFFCWVVSLLHTSRVKADIIAFDGDHETETFLDSEWPLAQPIWKKGMEGVLVGASPPDACSNISGPPEVNCSFNWFVLITGNSCTYDAKVYYAQLSGYSAAIIYHNGPKDFTPYKRHSKHIYPYPNISAVVIRANSGLILKEKYLYTIDERCRIYIFPNNSFNIIEFLFLFAIVAGIFIVVMLAFMIVRCIQHTRHMHNNRLSSRHLRQLLTSRFKKGDPYETCAICLEDYSERDKLRILPCLHGYHAKCIDPWLTNNKRICPVCKQKVVLAGEFSENDTESDTESRAETAPLLRNARGSGFLHGTFNARNVLPINPYHFAPSDLNDDTGETTSRDVTSDALDETSDEECAYITGHHIDLTVEVVDPSDGNATVFQCHDHQNVSGRSNARTCETDLSDSALQRNAKS